MKSALIAALGAALLLQGCAELTATRATPGAGVGGERYGPPPATLGPDFTLPDAGGAPEGEVTLAALELPIPEFMAVDFDPTGRAPMDDPVTCLARTIYWEAKGEGAVGMRAVAHVVANRVASPRFRDTFCAVVKAGGEEPPCQFSWWCDGRPDDIVEPRPFAEAREIARQVLNGDSRDPTGGATLFHAETVRPGWASRTVRTVKIGAHIFYRLP